MYSKIISEVSNSDIIDQYFPEASSTEFQAINNRAQKSEKIELSANVGETPVETFIKATRYVTDYIHKINNSESKIQKSVDLYSAICFVSWLNHKTHESIEYDDRRQGDYIRLWESITKKDPQLLSINILEYMIKERVVESKVYTENIGSKQTVLSVDKGLMIIRSLVSISIYGGLMRTDINIDKDIEIVKAVIDAIYCRSDGYPSLLNTFIATSTGYRFNGNNSILENSFFTARKITIDYEDKLYSISYLISLELKKYFGIDVKEELINLDTNNRAS